jgi:hypothetical protein
MKFLLSFIYSSVVPPAFRILNRFVRWDKLWRYLGLFNLMALRADLRKYNLHDTSTIGTNPPAPGSSQLKWDPGLRYWRTVDGSFNDLKYPTMGKAGTRFGRNFSQSGLPDQSTITDASILHPSPREVSRKLLTRERFRPAKSLNLLAAAWIQFQVHDWVNHKRSEQEYIEIPLEPDDRWPHGRVMRVARTERDATRSKDSSGPPTFISYESHWWDGSQIYGSTLERQRELRSGFSGRLKIQNGRLPKETNPERPGIDLTGSNDNYWVGLSLLHTLFALEHNAICDRLRVEYPDWGDERLFQTARLINAALIAKIHTLEWTPAILSHPTLQIGMRGNWWGLVGEGVTKNFGRVSDNEVISGIPGSSQAHHAAPYALTEEFVSVYRLHPLIPDDFRLYSAKNDGLLGKFSFLEFQGNNTRPVMEKFEMADLFYSFGVAHPGAIALHNFPRFLQVFERINGEKLDVAAIDILRDRERGVPRYNEFRRLLRIAPVKSFKQLTGVPRFKWFNSLTKSEIEERKQWAEELERLYEQVDKVDLMVGLFAERPPKGFGFSDTAFRIFILMASRRLKSDRFFTTDFTPAVYTRVGLDWINANGMKSVLQRHYPELSAAYQNVANPFAPWTRIEEPPPDVAALKQLSVLRRLQWALRKRVWNLLGIVKFGRNKPVDIKAPKRKLRDITPVPLRQKLPGVPIDNIRVADHVPADEKSLLKSFFYNFQVWMYKRISPMQPGLPSIAPDPEAALAEAYTKRHRKYLSPPVLPPELEGAPELGWLAVAGPYAGYLQAAGEGAYHWDLRELAKYQHHDGLHRLGVRVLFRVDAASRALQACEIETELGVSRAQDANWQLAKRIALCAVSSHTSLVRHFNWVHLASGAPLAIATRNCLPHDHPLCRLLWPHMFGTQQSNEIVTKGQMVRVGDFETIFSFTHEGMCKLFADTYEQFDFSVNDPAEDANRRGIVSAGFDLPTQKNLAQLFDVMHEHARNYIGLYYKTDSDIQHDPQVCGWLDQLNAIIPNGIKVTRNDVTVAGLSRLIARFIYLVTVQHELLGTFLWNYQLWTHRQPARVYRDGRREPLDVYQRLVNANFNLNVKRTQLMDDFSHLGLDDAGKQAFTAFSRKLQELQSNMEQQPWAVWRVYPNILEVNINA